MNVNVGVVLLIWIHKNQDASVAQKSKNAPNRRNTKLTVMRMQNALRPTRVMIVDVSLVHRKNSWNNIICVF